jgi:hypothetical protein
MLPSCLLGPMAATGLTGSVWQMKQSFRFGADGNRSLQVLWGNGERVFRRGRRQGSNGNRSAVLAVLPAAEHPRPHRLNRVRDATRKGVSSCRKNTIR